MFTTGTYRSGRRLNLADNRDRLTKVRPGTPAAGHAGVPAEDRWSVSRRTNRNPPSTRSTSIAKIEAIHHRGVGDVVRVDVPVTDSQRASSFV